jgi:endonuclease-3
MVCLPVGPRCDACELSSQGLCPSARKYAKKGPKKRGSIAGGPKVEIAFEEEEVRLQSDPKIEDTDE